MYPTTHSFTRSLNVCFTLFSLLSFLAFLPSGYAARNISIDDTNGDVVNGYKLNFDPPFLWENNSCTKCRPTAPDPNKAFSGTYRNVFIIDETQNRTSQFLLDFTGTGVYVFVTVADIAGAPPTNLNITLDQENMGSFDWTPGEGGTGQDYIYGMIAYQKDGLTNGPHSLIVSCEGTGPDRRQLFNVDRVVYQVPDDGKDAPTPNGASDPSATAVPSSNPNTNTLVNASGASKTSSKGVIIGAAIGSLVFIIIVVVLVLLFLRRRRGTMAPSQAYLKNSDRLQPISSTDDLLEKGISLAKVDSKASVDTVVGDLPELPKIAEPKYPGGYAPGGLAIPPQARVAGGNLPSPTGSPVRASLVSRLSSISSYGILQRASRLGGPTRSASRGKLQISTPTLDPAETRKAKIREFERQQWKVRSDIKELEDQLEGMTDEREKERLKIRMLRLREDLVLISVQQNSLADVPLTPPGNKDTV